MWGFILAMYAHSLVTSYTGGRDRTFYLLLATIPFVFLCWALSILLSGKDIRDRYKNLTDSEREESRQLAESYGARMGLFIAGPFAIVCSVFYAFLGIRTFLPYVLLFCLLIIVAAPFMVLHRQKMRTFMYSTEYAKQHGHDKEARQGTGPTRNEPSINSIER